MKSRTGKPYRPRPGEPLIEAAWGDDQAEVIAPYHLSVSHDLTDESE
jgi:hypothetical protein